MAKKSREANSVKEHFDARSLAMIDAFLEEDNEVMPYTLILSGKDGVRHEIPVDCSSAQARKIKAAIFGVGGDALAIPTWRLKDD
jgi:hypothetical protein